MRNYLQQPDESSEEYSARMRAIRRHKPVRQLAERFWEKVDKSGDCWVWTAGVSPRGYGRIQFGTRSDRRVELAHRLAWVLAHGPIPPNKPHVLHRCDNPPCVNPDHLFVGTDADNKQDMYQKGRQQQGDNHAHARLTRRLVENFLCRLASGEVVVTRHPPPGTISVRQEAFRMGVSPTTLYDIVAGRTWKSAHRAALSVSP